MEGGAKKAGQRVEGGAKKAGQRVEGGAKKAGRRVEGGGMKAEGRNGSRAGRAGLRWTVARASLTESAMNLYVRPPSSTNAHG